MVVQVMKMLRQKILRTFIFSLSLSLIILTVLVGYPSLFNLEIREAKADSSSAWLSEDFQYRKSHVINPAPDAGTNYQVRIKIDYSYSGTKHYLVNWSKSADNPLFMPIANRAWPACTYHNGIYYLYLGYYTGGSDIRLYTSTDEINFQEHSSSPVITRGDAGTWDEFAIEPHSIIYINGEWRLYYCGLDTDNVWRIGYANSSDLIHWTKYSANPIMSPVLPETSVADPQVFLWQGNVWLHYAARTVGSDWDFRVAWSVDGVNFTRSSLNPIRANSAPGGIYVLDDNEIYGLIKVYENDMWEVEAFHSFDGEHYTYYNDGEKVIPVGDADAWDVAEIGHLDVMKVDDVYKCYYAGKDSSGIFRIGLATTIAVNEVTDQGDVVHVNSNCRTDFGDVRFTDDDGITLLNYWMEEKVDGDYAIFWVEIADDLSSNPATIYLYYGNPAATTTSNGETTFLFFDDFLGTSYDSNKWQVVGSPTITVSNGELKIQRNSYSGSWSVQGLRSKTFQADEKRVIAKFKSNAFSGACAVRTDTDYLSVGQTNKAHFEVIYVRDIFLESDKRSVGGSSAYTLMASDVPSDTYYTFYTARWGSSYFKGWLNGGYKGQVTANVNDGSNYIGLFIEEWASHGTVIGTYDWVAIAKYVDSEPSHGFWGTEETFDANKAPAIDDFQAPIVVYANKYFYLNATINDPDGVADFANATVELSDSVVLQWTNSTNTFSVQTDPNGYCTLDPSGSILADINSTAYTLSWRVKLNWTYTEGYKSILPQNTRIFDSQGINASSSHPNLFYFEDDLIVYNATVDDSRINPSQDILFSGTLCYQGTTAPPEDTSGITVKANLGDTDKGSTTSIGSDGNFSLSLAGETTIGSYSYLIYAITNEPSMQNQTVNVKVDRVAITFEANKTNPANGATVTFTVSPRYESDNEPVASFTYDINRNGTLFKNDSPSSTFTDSASDTTYIYDLLDFVDLSNGILTWVDPPNLVVSWWEDLSSRYVIIDQTSASNERADVDSIQTISFHVKWDNGSDVIQGSIYVNGTQHTTNSTGWISFTTSSSLIGKQEWAVTGVSCGGVTTYTQEAQNPSIIWDRIQIVKGGTTNEQTMQGQTVTIWFQAQYEYNNYTFDNANGIIYVNNSQMSWSTTNNRWEYNYTPTTPGPSTFVISGFSDNSYGLTAINDLAGPQVVIVGYLPFSIISSSTISELAFNSTSKIMSFTVSGPSGTTGYTNVTIAKTLIPDIENLQIYVDGNQVTYAVTSTEYYWLIHFTYTHSTHEVLIILNSTNTN